MGDTDLLLTRHRLTINDYHRMAEAGILGENGRVELIDGSLFDRPPISQGHAGVVNALNRTLVLACGDRAIVSIQTPAQLDWFSEPRPDATLFRPRADNDRSGAPPGPADMLLVVEVADSTPRYDRAVKLPLYARRALPRCGSSICPGAWTMFTERRPATDTRRSNRTARTTRSR